MKDGPFLAAFKAPVRWSNSVDLFWRRAWLRWRGQERYDLGGACHGCARCCEAPSIKSNTLVWYWPTLRRLFLSWQRRVNGFELVERDRTTRTFVFRCTHFDWGSRRCDSYESRPAMCRDYPRLLLESSIPTLFDGCGHRPVAKDAAGLRLELERAIPDEARRIKIFERLFLDP